METDNDRTKYNVAPEAATEIGKKAKAQVNPAPNLWMWLWRAQESKTKICAGPFLVFALFHTGFRPVVAQKDGSTMKKRTPTYTETSGCNAPKDSAEFAAWLQSLPPYLRNIVIEDLEARQKSEQAPAKNSRPQ